MKDNEVIEVQEDATIHYFDLDVCEKEAASVVDELITKQTIVPNYDFHATIFSLFIQSIYILSEAGWEPEELLDEVLMHTVGLGDEDDES